MEVSGREAKTTNAQIVQKVSVSVPGSSANVGPGFDACALALCLYTKFRFALLEKDDPAVPLFKFQGAVAQSLPANKENLIYKILSKLLFERKDLLARIRVSVESEIPLGRGLGSSAACVAGTVFAAHKFLADGASLDRLIAEASEIEGHPDNVAASLNGGFVVCAQSAKGIVSIKLAWPSDWKTLLVVPNYQLATKDARAVLPKQISMDDAVFNIQKASLLVSAVAKADKKALKAALCDRLHEPYREALVPELKELRKILAESPALGCVLSGAGSSVLVVVEDKYKKEVLESARLWASKKEGAPAILDLSVDNKGLEEIHE